MKCDICGKEIVRDINSVGTGYGIDKNKRIVCYACCGEMDKQALFDLKKKEKMCLYLTGGKNQYYLTNWPGTLKIRIYGVKESYHNFAGIRRDFWFDYLGKEYHGKQFGNNSEIAYIERIGVV